MGGIARIPEIMALAALAKSSESQTNELNSVAGSDAPTQPQTRTNILPFVRDRRSGLFFNGADGSWHSKANSWR